jgi:hypothetical protein
MGHPASGPENLIRENLGMAFGILQKMQGFFGFASE